jgi:hypothetical protein
LNEEFVIFEFKCLLQKGNPLKGKVVVHKASAEAVDQSTTAACSTLKMATLTLSRRFRLEKTEMRLISSSSDSRRAFRSKGRPS